MTDPGLVRLLAELAVLATILWHVSRERRRVRAEVGRFLHTDVAKQVIDAIRVEGRRCEVTVLFTDLRGFTCLSEQMPPEKVVGMLNAYFEQMVRVVESHGGWVDKFLGDGMMAVFGEMRGRLDHAERAAACSLELRECIARLNIERSQRALPALKLGIAINTGQVVAGTVGAARRLDYTIIGDTVNVASRLEHLNVALDTDIIVAKSTRDRAGGGFLYDELGLLCVRGHEAAVEAYRLVRRAEGVPEPAAAPL